MHKLATVTFSLFKGCSQNKNKNYFILCFQVVILAIDSASLLICLKGKLSNF